MRLNSEWMEDKETKLRILIENCLLNDRRAQEQFFRLYYGRLIVVVLRYISDRDTAEEVLQGAFIKIFDKLGTYDFKGSFDGWMRRIIVNAAIDYIRKTKNKLLLSDLDTDFVEDKVDLMVEQESIKQLELKSELALEAIQKLPPVYRTVFNLFVLENRTHKEIAHELGISQGASKSNLSKAKIKLRKILTEQYNRTHLFDEK